jgi:alkylation response protein AidB-like acyl-CoA dehydrogenase
MLLEFDEDQRLLQDTVRDVVGKECPPALIRGVADNGADPTPLWKVYVDLGWTELTDPSSAVELAIVLEELGRATDPTPYLATMTQFVPLAGDLAEPSSAGAAVFEGVTARRGGGGWLLDGTARHVLDGDRADRLAVVTAAGVFVVPAGEVTARSIEVLDPVLHVAELSFAGVRMGDSDRCSVDVERCPAYRADGFGVDDGGGVSAHSGSGVGACADSPAVRGADRVVSGGQAQGGRYACGD